jgi:hypothetical protein
METKLLISEFEGETEFLIHPSMRRKRDYDLSAYWRIGRDPRGENLAISK